MLPSRYRYAGCVRSLALFCLADGRVVVLLDCSPYDSDDEEVLPVMRRKDSVQRSWSTAMGEDVSGLATPSARSLPPPAINTHDLAAPTNESRKMKPHTSRVLFRSSSGERRASACSQVPAPMLCGVSTTVYVSVF